MARHQDAQPHPMRLAGLALLAALLFIAALVWSGWRSGLLTLRPTDITLRLPEVPVLPRVPIPDPQPAPLPRPGPQAEA